MTKSWLGVDWGDPEFVERLRHLREVEHLSHREIASRMGTTKGAVAGAIWRYLAGNRTANRGPAPVKTTRTAYDTGLVEPWAEYTARKKKERAEAKAKQENK